MIILVGVTINVAINGGLIQKAEKSKEDTQKALEKEELMSAVVVSYDDKLGKISSEKLNNEIQALQSKKYSKIKETAKKMIVKGPSGTEWQIDLITGKIKEKESDEGYTGIFGGTTQALVFSNDVTSCDEGMFTIEPIWKETPLKYMKTSESVVLNRDDYPKGEYNKVNMVVENTGLLQEGAILISKEGKVVMLVEQSPGSEPDYNTCSYIVFSLNTVESIVWNVRGLTTEDILYDTLYYSNNGDFGTIQINSDGSIMISAIDEIPFSEKYVEKLLVKNETTANSFKLSSEDLDITLTFSKVDNRYKIELASGEQTVEFYNTIPTEE